MEQDNKTKGKVSIILGVVMAVISVLIFCGSIVDDILPGGSWILLFITTPLAINGFAYLVNYLVFVFRGSESDIVLPLACLSVSMISAIIGLISYMNNHKIILGELEAQLIWFFISIPSLVVAIIHFIISYIRMSRRVKAQEKR